MIPILLNQFILAGFRLQTTIFEGLYFCFDATIAQLKGTQ
jgi:hypothetical protein